MANLVGMDFPRAPAKDQADTPRRQTEEQSQSRLAWDVAMIAQADADIAAGRLADRSAVDAWIDSIGSEHELPVPYSGR